MPEEVLDKPSKLAGGGRRARASRRFGRNVAQSSLGDADAA